MSGNHHHEADPEYEKYEEDEDIPLHRKNVFSSGIRRQRVAFVKASSPEPALALGSIQGPVKSSGISDTYLSLVMASQEGATQDMVSKDGITENAASKDGVSPEDKTESKLAPSTVCDICKLTINLAADPNAWNKHEASLAHQVSLNHSHPPSALDRSRMGLAYLESYGWDPDARQGLGASGQGRQYPIKPVAKEDTQGIGFHEQSPAKGRATAAAARVEEAKVKKMSAKEKRKAEQEKKRKAEMLHQEFYASDDVLRYMNSGSI